MSCALQILDDGRVTDSQGRTVSVKNNILIMTSNLGSQAILEGMASGAREAVKDTVMSMVCPVILAYLSAYHREAGRGCAPEGGVQQRLCSRTMMSALVWSKQSLYTVQNVVYRAPLVPLVAVQLGVCTTFLTPLLYL